jgi:hypothetical protein
VRIALVVGGLVLGALVLLCLWWRTRKRVEDYAVLRGENLDRVAWVLYELRRKPKETDDQFRTRVQTVWRHPRHH